MSGKRILIVDDDEDLVALASHMLAKAGYEVFASATGRGGLQETVKLNPDLILLDLRLPDVSGYDVCRSLRAGERTKAVPVIMLTASSGEEDVAKGFDSGVDDYVVKPFNERILLSRIQAVLRRAGPIDVPPPESFLKYGELTLDLNKRRVTLRGKALTVNVEQFEVLLLLTDHAEEIVGLSQISRVLSEGGTKQVNAAQLDAMVGSVQILFTGSRLRIEKILKVGYRLVNG